MLEIVPFAKLSFHELIDLKEKGGNEIKLRRGEMKSIKEVKDEDMKEIIPR
jgi:hypothetical protein